MACDLAMFSQWPRGAKECKLDKHIRDDPSQVDTQESEKNSKILLCYLKQGRK